MAALTEVVGALVDAAFRSGGITDAQHTDLHAKLNEPEHEPEAPVAPVVDVPSPFGTEGTDG